MDCIFKPLNFNLGSLSAIFGSESQLKLTVAAATDSWLWERLQISVVVPDLQPAAVVLLEMMEGLDLGGSSSGM